MMLIENKYKIGQLVFLITDAEQKERMITGILVRNTHLLYYLVCGSDETSHYDFEMTEQKDVLKTSTN